MAKKSNYQILSSKQYKDTPRGRDVYNRQQLERGERKELQTMTTRIIGCLLLSAIAFFSLYGLWCFGASVKEHAKAKSAYEAEQKVIREWNEAHPEGAVTVIGPDGTVQYRGDPPPEATLTDPGTLKMSWRPRSMNHVTVSLLAGLILFAVMYPVMKRNLAAQNAGEETTDINDWDNDQHIALPEELQENYDWFPDAGAHSKVQVSSMISHMMLANKGLRSVRVPKRYKSDVKDEQGAVVHYKGEPVLDENGDPVMVEKPMIDMEFGKDLFETSGADPKYHTFYDIRKVPYNPGSKNRDKLPGYETVADLINGDWYLPDYEPQRPGGAYIVDTAPVKLFSRGINA